MTRWPLLALLALLLGAMGDARAAEGALGRAWSGLWRTPDQRGQAALDAGDPATAAQLFRDPRRKAYAELKAGRYQEAAQGFAAFDDAAAQYDRGNALARAGELQQALQAYDAALAKDPSDRDARHNRDLIAKALAQQPPKAPGKPGSSGPSGKSAKSGKAGNSGSSGAPDNAASVPSLGDKPASSPSSSASSARAGQGHQASPAAAGGASQASAGAASAPAASEHDAAARARREAAAAHAAASSAGAHAAAEALGAASAPAGRDAPTTEQQLAEDQWLRGIPDDPAGLLRRKFLIQHLLRQQGSAR